MQKSETLFSRVKQAIFQDEQESLNKFSHLLDEMNSDMHDLKVQVGKNVSKEELEPYFDDKLKYMQHNFPDLFGEFVTKAIKVQIKESQNEVIDALYPIMGKLIGKYIRVEIEKLSQRIDAQLDKAFSLQGLWLRIKAFFSGVKYEDIILRNTSEAQLEEVFLILEGSGLLLGKYSRTELIDSDIIAGMLTGIKHFISDAFHKGEQNLDTLTYDDYEIVVFNFQTFYIACVLRGQLMAYVKEKLHEHVLEFCAENTINARNSVDAQTFQQYSSELKQHFYGFNEVDK